MPEDAEKIRIRLGVLPKYHDTIRVLAAKSKMSMSQYCEVLVIEAAEEGRELSLDFLQKRQPQDKKKPGRPKKEDKQYAL